MTFKRLRKQPRNLLAVGILISLVYFGLTSGRLPVSASARADAQRMVSLYVDGQERMFTTDSSTVGEVLKRSGVKLGQGDLVEPSANTPIPVGQFNINVYRARPVLIIDGARSYNLKNAYQSPRLLAVAAGLTVYPEDNYRTEVITDFVQNSTIGEKITIIRAKPFTVRADGSTRTFRTHAKTLGDALKGNIPLGPKDTVSADLAAPVVPGMNVTVTRVSEVVATETLKLPRIVKTVNDPTMLKGKTAVKTEGSDGQKTVTYRIHYKDGVEVNREQLQVVSQTEPVTKVVAIGTKVIFSGSVEYWRPQVEAAAAQWGLDPNMMLRIMWCESKGNAASVSSFIVGGEHPTGLFQYLPSTWRAAGGTDDNIFDGSTQIKLTAQKMAKYGTGAWECR